MDIIGVLSSPSQRNKFLLVAAAVIASGLTGTLFTAYMQKSPIQETAFALLTSILASGLFTILGSFLVLKFFIDPSAEAARTIILPGDIGASLARVAVSATHYRLYARTGRHFRAEILPLLIKTAIQTRQRIHIEAILLDLTDSQVCDTYADFRKASSFDRKVWSLKYLQTEILATILLLSDVAREHRALIDVKIYLTKRLSVFRIEGSPNELLVTREDPKDYAQRYIKNHKGFSGLWMELDWIRTSASPLELDIKRPLPTSTGEIFPTHPKIQALHSNARRSTKSPSPYPR